MIVAAELRFGAKKIGSSKIGRQLDLAETIYDVLPLTADVIQSYSDIRVRLERLGTPIGPYDLLIAAHAVSLDLPLVTANVREFSRVAGLRVENWLD